MGVADIIQLPPLVIRPRRHPVGRIRFVVRPPEAVSGGNVQEIRITARRPAQLLTMPSGERIWLTDRQSLAVPRDPDIEGVLRIRPGEQPAWLSHRALEEFDAAADRGEWTSLREGIARSWGNSFQYRAELLAPDGRLLESGLRPPQIGALHAIGSHWTHPPSPATVVMPTGTGKTETMLAARVALCRGTLLVVVPSQALREQTAKKFLNLGLLRELGNIPPGTANPIVGVIDRRPKTAAEWDILDQCHVIIATISTVAQGEAADLLPVLAEKCSTLFLDEAHHVAADTWNGLREAFREKHVLQFTATPFRRDGHPVDGKVIYNYPLRRAQEDGYFKTIHFHPVFEIDPDSGDRAIAREAVERLDADLSAGRDHILMARCATTLRAERILALYLALGQRHHPVLIHSDAPDVRDSLARLQARESRIVVCVDMLGEGFDLPQLKIAAVHDTHKSLAVLLQFTGRFTRSSGGSLGDASVVANIANQNVSSALERLYSEDADWNQLLSEFRSQAIKEHTALVEFLQQSKRMDMPTEDDETTVVSAKSLSE